MAELLTVAQIARQAGVSPRLLHYAMRVHRHGIDALDLAVEAGTLPLHRAAIIADLPAEQQPQALAAALRGERPPKRPTAAQRAAAEAQAWRLRCGLLALDLERLTGTVRISAIADACFRLIADGISTRSWTRVGCAQAMGSM